MLCISRYRGLTSYPSSIPFPPPPLLFTLFLLVSLFPSSIFTASSNWSLLSFIRPPSLTPIEPLVLYRTTNKQSESSISFLLISQLLILRPLIPLRDHGRQLKVSNSHRASPKTSSIQIVPPMRRANQTQALLPATYVFNFRKPPLGLFWRSVLKNQGVLTERNRNTSSASMSAPVPPGPVLSTKPATSRP